MENEIKGQEKVRDGLVSEFGPPNPNDSYLFMVPPEPTTSLTWPIENFCSSGQFCLPFHPSPCVNSMTRTTACKDPQGCVCVFQGSENFRLCHQGHYCGRTPRNEPFCYSRGITHGEKCKAEGCLCVSSQKLPAGTPGAAVCTQTQTCSDFPQSEPKCIPVPAEIKEEPCERKTGCFCGTLTNWILIRNEFSCEMEDGKFKEKSTSSNTERPAG